MKKLLDHGSIELIETWGSDERIIEAARMSTQKGFLGWGTWTCACCNWSTEYDELGESPNPVGSYKYVCPQCGGCDAPPTHTPGDEKLLKYLANNHHDTPFEFAGAVFQVRAPIFVFREWHRHRTQSYNEASARYSPLIAEDYVPTRERVLRNSPTNKQAGGLCPVNIQFLDEDIALLVEHFDRTEALYRRLLDHGWPKELARGPVSVSRYSTMRCAANLRNLIGFLRLRYAMNAQEEIRVYAAAMMEILYEVFPRTMGLFMPGVVLK